MEELNGLSQFYVDMESLVYIIKLIQYLFHPPKIDLRGKPINYDATNQVYNGGDVENVDATLTGDIIPGFVEEIKSLDLDEYKDHFSIYSADSGEDNY